MSKVGIEKINLYGTSMYLDQRALAIARNKDPDTVVSDFLINVRSLNPPWEDTVTMGANAAKPMLTEEEKEQIEAIGSAKRQQADLQKVAPGWKMTNCGPDMEPGLRAEYQGKKPVFMTHPLNREVGCSLTKTVKVPKEGKTTLNVVVANDNRGDFLLIVKVDGKRLLDGTIDSEANADGWADVDVDLTPFAGKTIDLELVNQANDWRFEAAYWAKVGITTQ